MNRTVISCYLLALALGITLGFSLYLYNEIQDKKNGAREYVALVKVDSLRKELVKHDTIIQRIKVEKIRIKKEYETDTIWINNASFDSLNWLFTKYYPVKPVSDSVYSEGQE